MAEFRKMLRDAAAHPGVELEVAAFLIETPEGLLKCERWPATARFREQRYRGARPSGLVGIVHTHPARSARLERPSPGDVLLARGLRLPVYVLTRWYIYVVDPSTGAEIALVAGKDWTTRPLGLEMAGRTEDIQKFKEEKTADRLQVGAGAARSAASSESAQHPSPERND